MLEVETPAIAVRRVLNEERLKRKQQEWRTRCYADILALYAHRLAIAQERDPVKVMGEARKEVQARLHEKEWLGL